TPGGGASAVKSVRVPGGGSGLAMESGEETYAAVPKSVKSWSYLGSTVSSAPREPVRRRHRIAGATPREVYDVVVDFPSYPRLFPEFKEARVVSRTGDVARVEFRAQVVLAVGYVLDLACRSAAPAGGWTFGVAA